MQMPLRPGIGPRFAAATWVAWLEIAAQSTGEPFSPLSSPSAAHDGKTQPRLSGAHPTALATRPYLSCLCCAGGRHGVVVAAPRRGQWGAGGGAGCARVCSRSARHSLGSAAAHESRSGASKRTITAGGKRWSTAWRWRSITCSGSGAAVTSRNCGQTSAGPCSRGACGRPACPYASQGSLQATTHIATATTATRTR